MEANRFNAMLEQTIAYCQAKHLSYCREDLIEALTAYEELKLALDNEEQASAIINILIQEAPPVGGWKWIAIELKFELLAASYWDRNLLLKIISIQTDELTDAVLDLHNRRKNRLIHPP